MSTAASAARSCPSASAPASCRGSPRRIGRGSGPSASYAPDSMPSTALMRRYGATGLGEKLSPGIDAVAAARRVSSSDREIEPGPNRLVDRRCSMTPSIGACRDRRRDLVNDRTRPRTPRRDLVAAQRGRSNRLLDLGIPHLPGRQRHVGDRSGRSGREAAAGVRRRRPGRPPGSLRGHHRPPAARRPRRRRTP